MIDKIRGKLSKKAEVKEEEMDRDSDEEDTKRKERR